MRAEPSKGRKLVAARLQLWQQSYGVPQPPGSQPYTVQKLFCVEIRQYDAARPWYSVSLLHGVPVPSARIGKVWLDEPSPTRC